LQVFTKSSFTYHPVFMQLTLSKREGSLFKITLTNGRSNCLPAQPEPGDETTQQGGAGGYQQHIHQAQ
jgi:hypothetical protein